MLRGKSNAPRVASAREAVDVRPAGIGQAEQLADFVEGLAGSVVASLAEQPVLAEALDLHQQRVAAAHDQRRSPARIGRPKKGESRWPSM